MATPYALISTLTGIGGHILNGKRRKAYTYLLILLAWPFLCFLFQVVLVVAGATGAASPTAATLIFLSGLAVIWGSSVAQALNDRRAIAGQNNGNTPKVTLEIVFVSSLIYSSVLYGVFGFVVSFRMQPGERIPLFELSSSTQRTLTRRLPEDGGDLVLVGTLGYKGQPLMNAKLLLLFQDGYRTPEIETNSLGEFEYRLPPGDWRFLGPLVVGHESSTVSVAFTPDMMRPTFQVAAGSPRTKVQMRIAVQ